MQQKKDEGYQLIRFVLIWTIVVQHVLTTASENGIPKPYLLEAVFYRLSGCFGQLAVSLFFMLSGALLWKNHRTAENPAAFQRKGIRIISTGIITILFFLNLRFPVMTMGDGWYSFTRGIFFFWMGMIFEEHSDVLDRRSTALLAFAGFAAVYFFQYQRMLGSVFLPNILASLCSFPVLYRLGIEADALLSRPFFARLYFSVVTIGSVP